MNDFKKMWADQLAFNYTLRGHPPTEFESQSKLTKDMVLYLMSELDELLRTTVWKGHRKQAVNPNRAHTLEECIDIFKLWMSLAQIWGFTPDEIVDAYRRKSAVCVQRHAEEFVKQAKNIAVIDIDNVLCDYITGLCDWLEAQPPESIGLPRMRDLAPLTRIRNQRLWLNARTLEISEERWQYIKHRFRTEGGKRELPLMPGAAEFLQYLRDNDYTIALLTSRPIDKYPNIFSDTIDWLKIHNLEYDFVWWAHDKAERLVHADIHGEIQFAVDDDPRYVEQFARLGLPIFWVKNSDSEGRVMMREYAHVQVVSSVAEIPARLEHSTKGMYGV